MTGKRLEERTEISGEGDEGRGGEADRGKGEVERIRRGEIGEGDRGDVRYWAQFNVWNSILVCLLQSWEQAWLNEASEQADISQEKLKNERYV